MRAATTLAALACLLALAAPALATPPAPAARLGVVTKPGATQNLVAESFAAQVDQASGGRIRVEILHTGAAGDETQIVDKLRAGQLELAVVTAGICDQVAPAVAALEYPFLFADYAQADRVLQGPAGAELLAAMDQAGIKGLAWAENGFRHLTNNLRPVRSPADLAGLRLRVMESRLQQDLWRRLGAEPLPHPWPINDLLAQGRFDGQENPLWVIKTYELEKLQKHLSLTAHVYSAHLCAANPAWLAQQTPADRQLIAQAMLQAATHQRAQNRAAEAGILRQLQAAGMQIVHQPDRAAFQARAAALADSPLIQEPPVRQMLERLRAALR